MKIWVNGEERDVADGQSVTELLESLGNGQRRIAVEINLEIVPRSAYLSHSLQAGDRVEIVQAIGGG